MDRAWVTGEVSATDTLGGLNIQSVYKDIIHTHHGPPIILNYTLGPAGSAGGIS